MHRRFLTMSIIGFWGALIFPTGTHAVSSMVEDAWSDEYSRFSHDLDPDNKVLRWYDESKVKDYAMNEQALITEQDKSPLEIILRRTEALLNDLAQMDGAPDLSGERNQLEQLAAQAQSASDKEAMFKQIAGLRRTIAFKNPLIDFDQIVFFMNSMDGTPHMVLTYNEMRDNDNNNPGIYVLKDAFKRGPTQRTCSKMQLLKTVLTPESPCTEKPQSPRTCLLMQKKSCSHRHRPIKTTISIFLP